MRKRPVKADFHPFQRALSLSFAVLIFLTICCYFNSLSSPFTLDDNHLVVKNRYIRELADIERVITHDPSRPLLMISYAVNFHLGGLNPFGYHLTAVLVHALVSILLLVTIIRLPSFFKGVSPGAIQGIAYGASILFVSGPVFIEAITYTGGRSSSLCALFYLASFLFFLKSIACRRVGRIEGKKSWGIPFAVSLICYLFSLGVKELAATLPLVLTAFCLLMRGSWSVKLRELLLTLPFYALLVPLFVLRFMRQGAILEKNPAFLLQNDRIDYLLTQLQVVPLHYINKLILPIGLNLDIDFPVVRELFTLGCLISVIVLILLFFFCVRASGVSYLPLFGLLWFAISLLPTSSIIPIQDVAVERRAYLPGIGFVLFFSWLTSSALKERKRRAIWLMGSVAVALLFSANVITRNHLFIDEMRLWGDALKKSPNKARAHYAMGYLYEGQKDVVRSIMEYSKAIKLDPGYADAWYGLGLAFSRKGIVDKSEAAYGMSVYLVEGVLEYHKEDMGECAPCHESRYGVVAKYFTGHGRSLYKLKKPDAAEKSFQTAIQVDVGYIDARISLGNLYAKGGRPKEAEALYKGILRDRSDFTPAIYNLAMLYLLNGEAGQARSVVEQGLELKPHDQRLKEALSRVEALNVPD